VWLKSGTLASTPQTQRVIATTELSRDHETVLSAERLESRQMLSTVSISAVGSTGEEVMVVTAGETEVFRTTVFQSGTLAATRNNTFTFEVDDSLTVSNLRIKFVNDFFDPGVKDRNLIVEEIQFNGFRTQLDALNVFSTGTWLVEDRVQNGFGRGNILHSNGFFQVANADEIEFNGNVWQTSRPVDGRELRPDTINNELVLSGQSGRDFSISRQIDIEPSQLSVLTIDAWRNVISGSFNDGAAGAGINFYDADGQLVDTFDNPSFELNENATDPSNRIQSNQFRVPGNATTAFLWVWVQGNDQGSNISLRLTDFRLEPADVTADVTPPTARLTTLNGSGTQFGATSQSLTFLVNGNSVGAPSVLVPGAYEVRLLGETVRDDAGNFAPGQSLGDVGPFTLG